MNTNAFNKNTHALKAPFRGLGVMKIKTTILVLLITCGTFSAFAQETARERIEQTRQEESGRSTIHSNVRAQQMNRHQTNDIENAKWLRVVYRYLDLSQEENAPLYYPVTPEEGRMNLFTMIFKLLSEDKISAYEYLDGREVFAPQYKVDFKEFLERFGVYYETQNGEISVADVDIPSNEVQGYFVKEAYFFETGTSNYGIKTLAICPVIHRMGDYEATTTRYPLFWIPYSEIMPYALQMPVMTSSLNNAMSGTIDDFFRKRDYKGEIYKTVNPRNLAISQYTTTPEEREAEQNKIEQELLDFQKNLWKESDSIPASDPKKTPRFRKKRSASTSSSNTMRDRRY